MPDRLAQPLTQGTAGCAHALQLTGNIRIRGRMAEDCKDDSMATDDDSDYTGADGNQSLNNVVNTTPTFPFYFPSENALKTSGFFTNTA